MKMIILAIAALALTACIPTDGCLKKGEYATVMAVQDLGLGADSNRTQLKTVTLRLPNGRVRVCAVNAWVAAALADGMMIDGEFADESWKVG